MRLLSYLTTTLMAFLLVSCGGGGGSAGLPVSGSVTTLVVAAPGTVTLAVGTTQQYTISGGVKPYTVLSSNPSVVAGWLIGENVVAVGTASPGSATVTVQDSKGTAFGIAVTAGTTTVFSTTAPSTLTIAPGPYSSQTYTLFGGIPPYKAVSNFPSIASVAVNGSNVTLSALQVPTTGNSLATITYSDSSSPPSTLTTTVTLGALPLQVLPTQVGAVVGSVVRSVITGGTPPYHAIVGITDCATNVKIVNGNILEVTAFQACTGTIVSVFDSNNQTAVTPQNYTITAGALGLQVNPTSLQVPENANTPNLQLTVVGATVGTTLQVFTTNSAILAPQTPVLNSDGTWTIPLTGGNTCSLPVTPAQPQQAGPPFVPAVPATGGDRSATITVIDSLGHIGTSIVTVKDTNGVGGC